MLKSILTHKISAYLFCFCVALWSMSCTTHMLTLSFDSLFPLTWYEKGLHATLSAWHKVSSFISIQNDIATDTLDMLVGKCAFALFCLDKMQQKQQHIVEEDAFYFSSLLHVLENKIVTRELSEHEDQLLCMEHIISKMKDYLHIPSDIKTE